MKYDFKKFVLKNADGATMRETEGKDSPLWTAHHALRGALIVDNEQNQNTKLERYDLFLKISEATPATDFTAEEVAVLKKAALVLPTMFAGQLSRFLDQK